MQDRRRTVQALFARMPVSENKTACLLTVRGHLKRTFHSIVKNFLMIFRILVKFDRQNKTGDIFL